MTNNEGVVEYICEAGSGSEAVVDIELRTLFPGLGGDIVTQEAALTAVRVDHSPSEDGGQRNFLRHLVIKKLEDYFFRTGRYVFPHIPRPFGSFSEDGKEGYLYEFASGTDGFQWQVYVTSGEHIGDIAPVTLRDWGEFVGCFNLAGIDMGMDVTDADDGRIAKNIILHLPGDKAPDELSSVWKRIDFGVRSTPMNYETLESFLLDNRREIKEVLRPERYDLLILATKYLLRNIDEREIGRLEVRVGDYRRSSLDHFMSRGGSVYSSSASYSQRTKAFDTGKLK